MSAAAARVDWKRARGARLISASSRATKVEVELISGSTKILWLPASYVTWDGTGLRVAEWLAQREKIAVE